MVVDVFQWAHGDQAIEPWLSTPMSFLISIAENLKNLCELHLRSFC